MSIMQQSGKLVCDPMDLSNEQWRYMLTLTSATARKAYYKHLGRITYRALEVRISSEHRVLLLLGRTQAMSTHSCSFNAHLCSLTERQNRQAKRLSNEERRKEVRDERKQKEHIVYGLGNSALLLRLRRESMDKVLNWK